MRYGECMSLSPQAIQEFKEIYRQDYGVILTDAEALELAASFFNLMQTIFKPLPESGCES